MVWLPWTPRAMPSSRHSRSTSSSGLCKVVGEIWVGAGWEQREGKGQRRQELVSNGCKCVEEVVQ